jgi:Tfp pilus assembly protein PilW
VPTAEGGGTNNKFACRVESKSPSDNTTFAPGTDFSVSWRVTNTGSEKWDSASADYRYVSGDKIHQTAIYDLNKSVNVGKSTDLTVAMKAPGNAGSFSTTWNIFIGKTSFCKMKLTIIVK